MRHQPAAPFVAVGEVHPELERPISQRQRGHENGLLLPGGAPILQLAEPGPVLLACQRHLP